MFWDKVMPALEELDNKEEILNLLYSALGITETFEGWGTYPKGMKDNYRAEFVRSTEHFTATVYEDSPNGKLEGVITTKDHEAKYLATIRVPKSIGFEFVIEYCNTVLGRLPKPMALESDGEKERALA